MKEKIDAERGKRGIYLAWEKAGSGAVEGGNGKVWQTRRVTRMGSQEELELAENELKLTYRVILVVVRLFVLALRM